MIQLLDKNYFWFSFSEEKPIFTLLQERLDNSPPRVSITFPDGHTDNLILRHFYAEEIHPNGKKNILKYFELYKMFE